MKYTDTDLAFCEAQIERRCQATPAPKQTRTWRFAILFYIIIIHPIYPFQNTKLIFFVLFNKQMLKLNTIMIPLLVLVAVITFLYFIPPSMPLYTITKA
jgi:hypothetical protein